MLRPARISHGGSVTALGGKHCGSLPLATLGAEARTGRGTCSGSQSQYVVEGGLEPGSFWCHVLCVRVLAARREAAGQCVQARIGRGQGVSSDTQGPKLGSLRQEGDDGRPCPTWMSRPWGQEGCGPHPYVTHRFLAEILSFA